MFNPATEKIKELAERYPEQIEELGRLLGGATHIYIDYANVLPWAKKLGWHVDPKRLKQLLNSFDSVKSVKFYHGTLVGDTRSEKFIKEIVKMKYTVVTKPVKIMRHSIDVTGIPIDSAVVIKKFIRPEFLKLLSREAVERINAELLTLNQSGIHSIKERKCNFDVELGRDMLDDFKNDEVQNFILWSNDSDFAEPVKQLLRDGRKAAVFTTAGRLSKELSSLSSQGLAIYDIKKIREFISRNSEMKPE